MHILTVISHPDRNSLSHALAEQFAKGAEDAGHTIEVADLHAEGFNPLWNMEDIGRDHGKGDPQDVLEEQIRIERCDVVCMVFPLFWFGMPAMLKGWVDRVWSWGWAYDQLDDHKKSLLKDRSLIMLIPAGANPNIWEPYPRVEASMDTIWKTGTFGYFGFKEKQIHYLNGSTGSDARRKGLLERAYEIGREISSPKFSAQDHQTLN